MAKTVVIGASSGLGRCIGVGLAERGDQVALLARRRDRIENAAKEAGQDAIAVGSRVFHQKFGYGQVLAVDDDRLEIVFEKAGQKRLLDRFVEKA